MAKESTKKVGEKVEAKKPIDKAPKKAKTAEIKLDHSKRYKIESNGTGPRMTIKGEILLHVGGQSAENLINKGYGKIVK